MTRLLPAGFEDFEPFADWALPLESQRHAKRFDSTTEELRRFYDVAVAPGSTPDRTRIEEVVHYLNRYELGPDGATNHIDAPEEANRLYLISLAIAGVAYSLEAYGEVAPDWVVTPDRMAPTSAADVL